MRIAAILEDADQNFARAIQTVDGYHEYYGTYLPRERLEEELGKLQQVRTFDPSNLKLALKTARIAVSLERWTDVVAALDAFVTQWESTKVTIAGKETTRSASLQAAMEKEAATVIPAERRRARDELAALRDTRRANLLLDYGTAQWRLGEKDRVRQYLNWATGLDLGSADALIALADTFDEEGKHKRALEMYGEAFEVNPLEPRAVRGYLQLTAEKKRNLDFVPPMRPTLQNVIQRCRERASLGIYLPWAYFDIGCFSLLLGEPYDGIESYAKAVELSHSGTPIEAVLERASRLCDALEDTSATEWSLLERFLLVAMIAKRYRIAENLAADLRVREEELVKAKKAPSDAVWADLDERKAEALALRSAADAVRDEIGPKVANAKCPKLGKQVVIVAGGCAPGDEQRLQDYAPLLKLAFRDYEGTIFSGGTCSGLGQMVGDLPDSSRGPILKVACLPESLPTYHDKHIGYVWYKHRLSFVWCGLGVRPHGLMRPGWYTL